LIPPQQWLAAFHYSLTESLSPTFRKDGSRLRLMVSTAGKPFVSSGLGHGMAVRRASKPNPSLAAA